MDAAPDDVSALAGDARLKMHYFDSRGVFRVYDASIDAEALRLWRDAPRLSQRFVGTFVDGGHTMVGHWQICENDVDWQDDLQITYRHRE